MLKVFQWSAAPGLTDRLSSVSVFAFRGDPGHRFSPHQDVHEASQHRGQTTPVLHVGRSVCVCVSDEQEWPVLPVLHGNLLLCLPQLLDPPSWSISLWLNLMTSSWLKIIIQIVFINTPSSIFVPPSFCFYESSLHSSSLMFYIHVTAECSISPSQSCCDHILSPAFFPRACKPHLPLLLIKISLPLFHFAFAAWVH